MTTIRFLEITLMLTDEMSKRALQCEQQAEKIDTNTLGRKPHEDRDNLLGQAAAYRRSALMVLAATLGEEND